MKYVSVFDLNLITELENLNHFDLVSPTNDKIVHKYLDIIGFDLNQPLRYEVAKHRTMDKKIVLGYLIRGEVKRDWGYIRGPYASIEDRLIVAGIEDRSRLEVMCQLLNSHTDYSCFDSDSNTTNNVENEYPESMVEPDYLQVKEQMQVLTDILFHIRGDQIGADGNYMVSKYAELYNPKK